jgi:biotin carboxyl carrier protein
MLFDATLDGRTVRVEVREEAGRYLVSLDGRAVSVDYRETGRDFVSLLLDGASHEVGLARDRAGYSVAYKGAAFSIAFDDAVQGAPAGSRAHSGVSRIVAPMPGKILRILVATGDVVPEGHPLLVMEAMKMENELHAPRAGRIQELGVREGQTVETGALLAVIV